MEPLDPWTQAAPSAEIVQSLATGTARDLPHLAEAAEWMHEFRRSLAELQARQREFGDDSVLTERADEEALVKGYCLALALVRAVDEWNGFA